jgi:hypothetical protein
VTAFGSDRVLIGAPRDNTAAPLGGAAYLFSTNGDLLTTFTNPDPAYTRTGFENLDGDWFGFSVAAVGNDRVLIGAYANDAPNGTRYAGTAYLFSTSGALLATLTHPVPTFGGSFGGAVAAVGSDRFLIGTPAFAFRATNAGSAYLFSIPPPPSLSIARSNSFVVLSWPAAFHNFQLEESTDLNPPWSPVTPAPVNDGSHVSVSVPVDAPRRFFRLRSP